MHSPDLKMTRLTQPWRVLAAFSVGLILAVTSASAWAQPPSKKVQIDLIADVGAVVPGQPFLVALRQRITPKWHTYWKNPGDSGQATEISWELPEGFNASSIHWPIPEVLPYGKLINYGYSDEVLLLAEITPPATIASGPVTLTANSTWLVCEKICIPENGSASLTLPIASVPANDGTQKNLTPAAKNREIIQAAWNTLPKSSPWPATAYASKDRVWLSIANAQTTPSRITSIYFFPDTWGEISHAAEQNIRWKNGAPTLTLERGDLKDKDLAKLSGVLALEEDLGDARVRHGFVIDANITGAPPAGFDGGETAIPSISLWQALVFALLGGAILNLMPCVFPVLSLKALSLATHDPEATTARQQQGLAYLAGVMVSFVIFAGVLISLRSMGSALGWGFQFQSPLFVLAMATLFLVLGLSLSGVLTIGGQIIGVGDRLTDKPGLAGPFFTGVLASIAATPCTAPFMGAAIGYALAQPALNTLLVILALGLGFAAPLTLLSFSSTVARIMPRPGPWMETLKEALAFPLYATVAWLVWVLSVQSGSSGVLAAAIVLPSVAFAAWLIGSPERAGWISRLAAVVIVVSAGVLAYQFADAAVDQVSLSAAGTQQDSLSEPYSEARLAQYRETGRPVFVNFTAAWCITCKVNEQVALSSQRFRDLIAEKNVAYLKGDWTRQDARITRMLKAHGRAGVPLYLLFNGRGDAPDVLPQILTEAMVVERLSGLPAVEGAKLSQGD